MNTAEPNDIASLIEAAAAKSHELGRILSDLALALRKQPMQNFRFGQEEQKATNVGGIGDERQCSVALSGLAARLPSLERSAAAAELEDLTVGDVRKLAGILQIRVPSKIRKAEAVDMLLEHVFDLPAGQQLIRTFHKRNSQPNHSFKR